MKIHIVAVLGCLLVLATGVNAQAWGERQRRAWYIGFALGGGDGDITVDGTSASFSDLFEGLDSSRIALNFKAGATINPNLLVGFDMTTIRQQGSGTQFGTTVERATQITNYNGVVTFFPLVTGVYFRGGMGLAVIMDEIDVSSVMGSYSDSATVSGFDVLVGAGYAFWLLRSFNLTLGLDYSRQTYGSNSYGLDSSQFYMIYLGFDWY